MIVSNQPVNQRDTFESWDEKAGSRRHQLTGGSQPGGASSGVRL
jgi:hypothetical protein